MFMFRISRRWLIDRLAVIHSLPKSHYAGYAYCGLEYQWWLDLESLGAKEMISRINEAYRQGVKITS